MPGLLRRRGELDDRITAVVFTCPEAHLERMDVATGPCVPVPGRRAPLCDPLVQDLHFRVEAKFPAQHIQQLKYWLSENPMWLVKHLSVAVDFAVCRDYLPNMESWYPSSREELTKSTVLHTNSLEALADLFNQMPNLAQRIVILCLDTRRYPGHSDKSFLDVCLQDTAYIEHLRTLQ